MDKILLPVQHPFRGIAEKLNRSQENIENLEAEIARFFKESKYPVLSNDKGEIISEAVLYHSKLPVPVRFSVLSGEIVHHLRSCLDHIVWHFSDSEYRRKNLRWIEFPILKTPPSSADMLGRFERKIKGITNVRVLDFIKRVQPHAGLDHRRALLLAIHDLDIVDKHRTLVIVSSTAAMEYPLETLRENWTDLSQSALGKSADFVAKLNIQGKLVPQVAFRNFAGRESEPVIQGLARMHNVVLGVVRECDRFL
jgi:hypothetical protein